MHAYMCFHRWRVFHTIWVFFLRLPERPYSGLVGEVDSPPIVSCWVQHGCNMPVCGIVFFHEVCRLTPGPFKNLKCSAQFLGIPLRIFVCAEFLEEAPKWLVNLLSISAQSAEFILPDHIGVLHSCHWVSDYMSALLWRIFMGSLPLVSLRDRGSEVLINTASRLRVMFQEVFSLPSVFVVSWRRRAWWGSSLLSGGLHFVSILPCVLLVG